MRELGSVMSWQRLAFAVRALARRQARGALFACLALCVLEFAVADPLHPGLNLRWPQSRDAALDRFLQTLPPEASIATQEEAYTHLALANPYARLLPELPDQATEACFVLIDSSFPDSARLQEYGESLSRQVRAHRFVSVAKTGGIELYRASHCR